MVDDIRNTPFNRLTEKDRNVEMAKIIISRYRRGGYKTPQDDALKGLISDVVDMLLKHFPQITIDEISDALEFGFSGKYGETRAGIYADKILLFIRAYRSEKGVDNRINYQSVTETVKRPVTESDIKQLLSTMFKLHRENKVVSYCCGLLFDNLYYLGLIDTDTPPDDFIKKAVEAVKNGIIEAMRHGDEFDRISLIESMKHINEANNEVVVKAKDLYVMDYFDSLITRNVDLDYLLLNKHVSKSVLDFKNKELS